MKKAVKFLSVILSVALLMLAFAGCNKNKEDNASQSSAVTTTSSEEFFGGDDDGSLDMDEAQSSDTESGNTEAAKSKYTAVIKVKNVGTITAELYPDVAPISVENFVNLAKSGFYDGITFHRIISGFMIQGGDPEGTGMGGSDKTIKGEFSANGVKNDLKHDRGVLSMARSGSGYEQYLAAGYKMSDLPAEAKADVERAFNSASSQFFIVHKDSSHLDGNYAAFGKVISGMDIVDKLATQTPVEDDNGTVLAKNQPVIESIKIK